MAIDFVDIEDGLCNILVVINVVIILTFGYLLTFTHNLYVLRGGPYCTW